MKNNLKYVLPYFIFCVSLFLAFIISGCTNANNQTQTIASNTQSTGSTISPGTTTLESSSTRTTITPIDVVNKDTVTPTKVLTLEPQKTSTPTNIPTTEEIVIPIPTSTEMYTEFRSVILYFMRGPTGGAYLYLPDEDKSQEIAPGYFPYDWSPSGQHFILAKDQNLYISNPDGSDIKLILENTAIRARPLWLNEEWVLLDTFMDIDGVRVNLLNISTGELQSKDEDEECMIIGVSPSGDYWFQFNTGTEQMEVANLSGTRTPVEIPGGWGDIAAQRMQFLPSGKTVITEGCEGYPPGSNASCHIYSSDINGLAISNIKSIYSEESWMHIIKFSISPDGKYLAILYEGDPNTHDLLIAFLNLDSQSIEYKYVSPNQMSDEYIWSADSTMIATPYWNESTQTAGIQTMNIFTGKINLIQTPYVPWLTSWRMLGSNK